MVTVLFKRHRGLKSKAVKEDRCLSSHSQIFEYTKVLFREATVNSKECKKTNSDEEIWLGERIFLQCN